MSKSVDLHGHFYDCDKKYIEQKLSTIKFIMENRSYIADDVDFDIGDMGECYHCGEDVILIEKTGN